MPNIMFDGLSVNTEDLSEQSLVVLEELKTLSRIRSKYERKVKELQLIRDMYVQEALQHIQKDPSA